MIARTQSVRSPRLFGIERVVTTFEMDHETGDPQVTFFLKGPFVIIGIPKENDDFSLLEKTFTL